MDLGSMPIAISTGIATNSYSDNTATEGNTYYYRVGAVKDGIEKISNEIEVTMNSFSPAEIFSAKSYIDETSLISLSGTSVNNIECNLSSELYSKVGSTGVVIIEAALNGNNALQFNNGVLANYGNLLQNWKSANAIWSFAVFKSTLSSTADKSYFCINASSSQNVGYSAEAGAPAANNNPFVYARRQPGGVIKYISEPVVRLNEWVMCYSEVSFTTDRVRNSVNGGAFNTLNSAWGSSANNENLASSGIFVGAATAAKAFPFYGEIACIVWGSGSIPSVDEIDKLMGWAAHKYGLTAKLPANHPYKSTPP
jgi:hypothetical protein